MIKKKLVQIPKNSITIAKNTLEDIHKTKNFQIPLKPTFLTHMLNWKQILKTMKYKLYKGMLSKKRKS